MLNFRGAFHCVHCSGVKVNESMIFLSKLSFFPAGKTRSYQGATQWESLWCNYKLLQFVFFVFMLWKLKCKEPYRDLGQRFTSKRQTFLILLQRMVKKQRNTVNFTKASHTCNCARYLSCLLDCLPCRWLPWKAFGKYKWPAPVKTWSS